MFFYLRYIKFTETSIEEQVQFISPFKSKRLHLLLEIPGQLNNFKFWLAKPSSPFGEIQSLFTAVQVNEKF